MVKTSNIITDKWILHSVSYGALLFSSVLITAVDVGSTYHWLGAKYLLTGWKAGVYVAISHIGVAWRLWESVNPKLPVLSM